MTEQRREERAFPPPSSPLKSDMRQRVYLLSTSSLLQLSAVRHRDPLGGSSGPGTEGLHFLDHVHPFLHAAKDNMPAIQPFCFSGADEELGTICVGSSVGHRQDTWSSVLQFKVLIGKLPAVDGLSTSSIVVSEVSSLAHELGDDSVESGAFISETMFSCAERTEVLCSFGHNFCIELEGYSAQRLVVCRDVEVNQRVTVRCGRPGAVETSRGEGQRAKPYSVG